MKTIGVTSRLLRGCVAKRRGYVALSRGYVAHHVCTPLFSRNFSDHFRPLPFFYPLSTVVPCGQPLTCSTPTVGNRRRPAAIGSPGYGVAHPTGGRVLPDRPLPARRLRRFPTWRGASLSGVLAHEKFCREEPTRSEVALQVRDLPVVCGLSLSHQGKARQGRVRPVGLGRGEPVGGCGTPAFWPGLSTPSRCGQRGRPRAGASVTHGLSFTTLLRPLAGA